MTFPLSPGSSRAIHAKRFGAELAKAMRARKAGSKRLAAAAGCTSSAIANWKAGGNLPRIDTAARLAEVLDWPRLVTIAREGRTLVCARCSREFAHQGGGAVRYCSVDCREIAEQLRRPTAGVALAAELEAELKAKANVRGGLPKARLAVALERYKRSDARRGVKTSKLEASLAGHRSAIAAMCAGCEPAGLCRDSACALRPVSPLPMASTTAVTDYRPADGPWGGENRAKTLAAIQAANAERWSRDGERERHAGVQKARYAAMTDEERAAFAQNVSSGRRKGRAA